MVDHYNCTENPWNFRMSEIHKIREGGGNSNWGKGAIEDFIFGKLTVIF